MADTVNGLLREAAAHPDPESRHEAEVLLAHALGKDRAWLFAHADCVPDAQAQGRFRDLLAARQGGEPLAYLLGRRGFWTLDLEVNPAVLIPRMETELLVELALARIPQGSGLRIADLGTGSGAIALAIASERPACRVLATDASSAALTVARANAARLGMANVEFAQGNWCAPLAGKRFDLIVSNPPYIAAGDPHLGQGDLRFEPGAALASGVDGLDAIREIVQNAPSHLVAGGALLLEHGNGQGDAVRRLLLELGFADARTWQDLEGRDRVSGGSIRV